MTLLSVNIDHIASIRQARQTTEPDPVEAAVICELAPCIRHHDSPPWGPAPHSGSRSQASQAKRSETKLNVEMATTSEMLEIACEVLPDQVTLVFTELPGRGHNYWRPRLHEEPTGHRAGDRTTEVGGHGCESLY